KKVQDENLYYKVKEIKEELRDFIRNRKNEFGPFEEITDSFESCEKNIRAIIDLYKNYLKILKKKKKEINKYEFSDLEDFCLEILRDSKICEEIKNQYKLIFIDEFQDTNPIQYEIVKKISRGNNVFIVG